MTRIHFLGGCKTIGSSAYLIEDESSSVLLDFGVSFGSSAPSFPKLIRPRNLTVALTHAHLDHSGGLPLIFASGAAPVYMTAITRELIRLLLKDFIRISEYYLPFEEYEMQRLFRRIKIVQYDEPVDLGNGTTLTFLDAGHIPGSASIQVETNTHRFYYSGDINTTQTQLLNGARIPRKSPDVVVLESTYAQTCHDPRSQIEKEFVEGVSDTIESGGSVLVPAFAVARSQEILCILEKHRIKCPIYLDGMAREAARIFLRHPTFFRDYPLLR
ncbi:MAG: MBL fold metallo-hydrolase, partial [Promethearchaeota archaeon]